MRVPDASVEKLLKLTGKFSAGQLKDLLEASENEKKPLQDIVVQANLLTEAELTKLYAEEIDVPFAEFRAGDLPRDTLQLIPEHVAHQYRSVAFDVGEDGVVFVAMEDPDDIQAINFLQKQLGKPIRVHIAPSSAIQAAIDQYGGSSNTVSTELAKVIAVEDKETIDEDVAEEDVAEDSPIAQTVNLIIDYGIKTRASDVHIEPRENVVIVRYRIDGVLHRPTNCPAKCLARWFPASKFWPT